MLDGLRCEEVVGLEGYAGGGCGRAGDDFREVLHRCGDVWEALDEFECDGAVRATDVDDRFVFGPVVVLTTRLVCMPGLDWKKLIALANLFAFASFVAKLAKNGRSVWCARFQAVWFGSPEPGHFSIAGTMCGPEDHMFSHVSSIHSRNKGTLAMALLIAE